MAASASLGSSLIAVRQIASAAPVLPRCSAFIALILSVPSDRPVSNGNPSLIPIVSPLGALKTPMPLGNDGGVGATGKLAGWLATNALIIYKNINKGTMQKVNAPITICSRSESLFNGGGIIF